jgi:hypothetical protein
VSRRRCKDLEGALPGEAPGQKGGPAYRSLGDAGGPGSPEKTRRLKARSAGGAVPALFALPTTGSGPGARPGEWDIRFATGESADGWEKLPAHAPGPTKECWERPRQDPRRHDQRQKQLRDKLGSRRVGNQLLEQWQYEVTGAGRVWNCPEDSRRTVWLTYASTGHPSATGS